MILLPLPSAEREEYLKSRGIVIEPAPSASFSSSSSSSASSSSAAAEDEDEDRIAWLRSRGVQIELAEDRNKKASTSDPIDPNKLSKVTLVKIPCNDKEPYSEMQIDILKKAQGDQLIKALSPFFSSTSTLNEEMFLENAKKQFANQAVSITKDTLSAVRSMGGAETFTLSR